MTGADIMLREFGRYVKDSHRTAQYAAAIARTVRPGDVALDLGAGFGLLSMLCVRAGAARVYAIEQGPYVGLGRAIAADNGMADRIVWVAGNSAQVSLPERVDVIVSETLGQWALEEFTVEYLHDAVHRLGKPDVRVVPRTLELQVAPASAPRLRREWAAQFGPDWNDVAGFDLRRLRQAVFANGVTPYVVVAPGDAEALAAAVTVARFELGASASSRFDHTVQARVEREGHCDGWLGTFEAELAPGITLTTAAGAQATHWHQVLFALQPSCPVAAGDSMRARFAFAGGGGWRYEAL